jgi:hypothetical protein
MLRQFPFAIERTHTPSHAYTWSWANLIRVVGLSVLNYLDLATLAFSAMRCSLRFAAAVMRSSRAATELL